MNLVCCATAAVQQWVNLAHDRGITVPGCCAAVWQDKKCALVSEELYVTLTVNSFFSKIDQIADELSFIVVEIA